mgnify:CR=1 FL=1
MNEIEFDWDDIIRNHTCTVGTSRVELTILDINAAKREIKVLAKDNQQMKVETCRLCVDEIGFLYFCYPHIYSEEIYIQESYL